MSPIIDVDAFARFEAAGWSQAHDGYHRFFGPITARAAEPLLDAARVRAGTTVLDVATGPGYLAASAAARGASVVGTDISAEILTLARRLHPGITFRLADAHRLDFADASFDAVVAGFLLPHLGDHHAAAAELVRVLEPGGRLALSTWDAPERVAVLGAVVAAVGEAGAQPPPDLPPGPPFFAFSDDTELTALLNGAGLTDVAVTTQAFTHRVVSADAWWDGVIGGTVRTAALVNGQTAPMRRRIRAAFDRIASHYQTDQGLDLPFSVKLASGRRR
ncbi:MAG: class I SAM-dependent methyltransferase [Euzebyaceae bacterium]|nr:class I SAM-dependent methyltransferase [Euzebyaceae bacterium]